MSTFYPACGILYVTRSSILTASPRRASVTARCPVSFKDESYVCACQYDDVLIKQDGKWKFKSRKVTFYYFVPLREGWGKERMQFPLRIETVRLPSFQTAERR